MTRWEKCIGVSAASVFVGLAWCEWWTWRASREAPPVDGVDSRRVEPGEAVLVLGNPLAVLHRWRVRIAVRSTDPLTARFVFTGTATRGPLSEARMMAEYAVASLGVPSSNVILEEAARTTVENIVNSIPLMADAPAIKVASDTFHARRARHILRAESPELASRLVRARDYIPGEWGLLHAFMILFEHYRRHRARPTVTE